MQLIYAILLTESMGSQSMVMLDFRGDGTTESEIHHSRSSRTKNQYCFFKLIKKHTTSNSEQTVLTFSHMAYQM